MQILSDEGIIRERAITFLCNKIKLLDAELVTKEVEEYLLSECKKVLQDVTADEFVLLLTMLSSLKIAKLVHGQQAIVDMVADQADLDKPFVYTEIDNTLRILQSVKHILPHFSVYVSSARFVQYICLNIFPYIEKIPKHENSDLSLELLKVLAEMAPNAINVEKLTEVIEITYTTLLNYLPISPQDGVDQNQEEETSILFTHVECLLFTFHQLVKHQDSFISAEKHPERHKDIKLRLQYLALKNQVYIKKLNEALRNLKEAERQKEENKLKAVALRTTTNINMVVKDLFHNPPTYKVNFTLSWKEPPKEPLKNITKRPSPITFERETKFQKKDERRIYQPPGGKYSTKFQGSGMPYRGGRGGRGRGGRGSWRY
ncbi:API5 [Cordylochernes scorpioides]|uniref:API5 n=1 Tax=Cordylochernes scorpioides TaxID=51811 RepID=A0ABY6K0B2_9ARAC|nr:API5 [Cordylochernes scorpioides]